MPACCGCHMGGGGGAAMPSLRPRPSRVSFDRSPRDGGGQAIGSSLVNGGTVKRRAPLAVTPCRLNRSPIWLADTSLLARGTRQWRARFSDAEERKRLFWEAPKKVKQCTSARWSAHVRPRTRLESGCETRARCGGHGTRLLHLGVRAVGPRGASPAHTSRASAGFPRSRNVLPFSLFRGRDASLRRTRGSRSSARAVSLERAPASAHPRGPLPPLETRALLSHAAPRSKSS